MFLLKNKQVKSSGEMLFFFFEFNQFFYVYKKNGYNNFKLLLLICQLRNKKNILINGFKCNFVVNNVKEIVIEDDDFILLILFLNGQYSFISCCFESILLLYDESRVFKVFNYLFVVNYYKIEFSERGFVKIKKVVFVGNDFEEVDDNKRLFVLDIFLFLYNYVEV